MLLCNVILPHQASKQIQNKQSEKVKDNIVNLPIYLLAREWIIGIPHNAELFL